MSKRTTLKQGAIALAGLSWLAGAAQAKCTPDSVQVGSVCMDTYEASVWRVPNPTTANRGLVKQIQQGKAKAADLTKGGATQLGVTGNDYAPCTANGQTCKNDIYAVSIAGVIPARFITWFQANVACTNAGKGLPSSAEWQMAVTGTPDPGPDNGTTDCNTTTVTDTFPEDPVNTGSRSSCVSAFGAYDMVGNVDEWVADWVPHSTACPGWSGFSNDFMCLAGADEGIGPGALFRGGASNDGTKAGPLAVYGAFRPSLSDNNVGFRCAR